MSANEKSSGRLTGDSELHLHLLCTSENHAKHALSLTQLFGWGLFTSFSHLHTCSHFLHVVVNILILYSLLTALIRLVAVCATVQFRLFHG